jgi:predicted porin
MNKSLLALAVLGAFAASAQAQSSVTVYGSFDGGVRYVDNVDTLGNSRLTVGSNGTYNSNRIGFRGTEDLGGGLSARFQLETGFNTGTGALAGNLFNRTATVGVGGAWGAIDIGHQYSVNFRTIGAYDPFNYKYTAIIPLAVAAAGNATATNPFGGTRFSNDIQYTGAFGPLTVRAEYALGETAGSTGNGSAQGVGATYAAGPFSFGGAYTQKKPNIGGATPSYQDNTQWTVGGAFKTGALRVAGGYINEDQEISATVRDSEVKNAWVGLSFGLTPALELSSAFYQTKSETATASGKRNLFIVGTTYALSKRTNLYADIDYSKLSGAARIGTEDKVTGVSVGLNHLF